VDYFLVMENAMFTLKSLSTEGIAAAHEKALRYRLLNEPGAAENICLDILEVQPDNQQVLITLLLALTDQLSREMAVANRARALLPRLENDYERQYYAGIICERQAKAILNRGMPGGKTDAYEWFCEAMDFFEKAEALRPPANDDALLRWNSCARLIMRHQLTARQKDTAEPYLE
jgi:hypothetical protein